MHQITCYSDITFLEQLLNVQSGTKPKTSPMNNWIEYIVPFNTVNLDINKHYKTNPNWKRNNNNFTDFLNSLNW